MGAFSIAAATIMSEVIEGEAIIIDMNSGSYFSTDGVGAEIWQAAIAGASREVIVQSVTAAYPGVPESGEQAGAFLNLLLGYQLLVEGAATSSAAATAIKSSGAYAAPQLQAHSDMKDLIMLDPIHDVDAVGWPTRREDTPPLTSS